MKRFDDYGAFRKSAAILKYGLERRTAAAERLLAAADLPTTFRALDIGTADGSMLKVLEGVFPSGAFLGMERSMRLCKVARANGLTVTCGDARRLPFLDGSFDLVLMCATLKHIREYQQVLAECRRVTVRAGYHPAWNACRSLDGPFRSTIPSKRLVASGDVSTHRGRRIPCHRSHEVHAIPVSGSRRK